MQLYLLNLQVVLRVALHSRASSATSAPAPAPRTTHSLETMRKWAQLQREESSSQSYPCHSICLDVSEAALSK